MTPQWWHFYVDGCTSSPCLDYCIRYGIQLTDKQNQKITCCEQNRQIACCYSWENITDYYLPVLRNSQIEEINTQAMNFQSNSQNFQQIENQLIQHNSSNIYNQNSQQNNLQNEYSQQIVSQNQALITMMQNLSNNTSTIQDTLQTMLHSQNTLQCHNNDTITLQTNSQSPTSGINNSQNTFQPSDSPINTTLTQSQDSIHQINLCDSCKRRNFPDQDLSLSNNQINICDSCVKSNFPIQPNLSVSQINNQIISHNFTNQNLTSNQKTTMDQNISNCTNNVNINSSLWKLGYIIIFVVSAYEQIEALFFTIKIDLGQFVKILGLTILGGIVNWIMKQRNANHGIDQQTYNVFTVSQVATILTEDSNTYEFQKQNVIIYPYSRNLQFISKISSLYDPMHELQFDKSHRFNSKRVIARQYYAYQLEMQEKSSSLIPLDS
ncbi:26391_t:CDS:2 [Dentiscutata erythropus]|uniref:26391_t:CDS:1 n=1 Tax=Dentiscutata erythropus TaxID=1348616 RepID=A0A9N9IGN5_9GLOM|nr:26391_t:CDS:2 [Dentiscutata erythropus]